MKYQVTEYIIHRGAIKKHYEAKTKSKDKFEKIINERELIDKNSTKIEFLFQEEMTEFTEPVDWKKEKEEVKKIFKYYKE